MPGSSGSTAARRPPPGKFVDRQGKVLGTHAGIIHYTVGQRRGLGLGIEHPCMSVKNGPGTIPWCWAATTSCLATELDAGNFQWIAYDAAPERLRVRAKIRYRQQEQPATVTPNADGTVHVSFDEPQRAIARGQAVVLYDGDVVVGGGTIL